ncbi:hypothetical protein [Companilactobacillus sp. DQM5]|uniref:hypothetical protein n=1 Tax=Companilactobacillus sp. DQM5 TaxID=3463359 RepID=UPI0040589AF9
MQITDGYTSIEANLKKNIFQIQLSPKQYKISGVEIIKNTLHSNSLLLAGNIEELSQSKAIISYELPKFTKSLDIVRNSMKYSQRIALALKLNVLNDQSWMLKMPMK